MMPAFVLAIAIGFTTMGGAMLIASAEAITGKGIVGSMILGIAAATFTAIVLERIEEMTHELKLLNIKANTTNSTLGRHARH